MVLIPHVSWVSKKGPDPTTQNTVIIWPFPSFSWTKNSVRGVENENDRGHVPDSFAFTQKAHPELGPFVLIFVLTITRRHGRGHSSHLHQTKSCMHFAGFRRTQKRGTPFFIHFFSFLSHRSIPFWVPHFLPFEFRKGKWILRQKFKWIEFGLVIF